MNEMQDYRWECDLAYYCCFHLSQWPYLCDLRNDELSILSHTHIHTHALSLSLFLIIYLSRVLLLRPCYTQTHTLSHTYTHTLSLHTFITSLCLNVFISFLFSLYMSLFLFSLSLYQTFIRFLKMSAANLQALALARPSPSQMCRKASKFGHHHLLPSRGFCHKHPCDALIS